MFGPQQMPPQGAKALVKALLQPATGRPSVSCVLTDPEPGTSEITFTNDGGRTAVGLRYVIAEEDGTVGGSVGNLPPSVSTTAALHHGAPVSPVRCVWMYADGKGRLHVRSYDGRHKRLGKDGVATDEACFQLIYG
jgi:hypothetical protein